MASPTPDTALHAPGLSAEKTTGAAWREFWGAIGDGAVPELPLADLERAQRATEVLTESAPRSVLTQLARSELKYLVGDHRAAVEALSSAETAPDAAPIHLAAVKVLRAAVVTDQLANDDRTVAMDALLSRAPNLDINKLDEDALGALPNVPDDLKQVAAAWYASSKLRFFRAAFVPMRAFVDSHERAQLEAKGQSFMEPAGSSDPVRVLIWSLDATGKPPVMDGPLGYAAAVFLAHKWLAPNGGVFDLDVPLLGMPDRGTWYKEGLPSVLEQEPTTQAIASARQLLDAIPEPPKGTPLGVVRDMLLAYADILEGRSDGASRSLKSRLAQVRVGDHPALAARLHMLLALSAVRQGSLQDAMAELDAALSIQESTASWGRSSAVLEVGQDLAERIFHLEKRYADGLALLEHTTALAKKHAYWDRALGLAVASVEQLEPLALDAQLLNQAEVSRRVIDDVESSYQAFAAKWSGAAPSMAPALGGMIGSMRLRVATSEATALSRLGAGWGEIQKKIEPFSSTPQGQTVFSSGLLEVLHVTHALAQGEPQEAADIAKKANLGDLQAALAAQRGEVDALRVLYDAILEDERLLATPATPKESAQTRYLRALLLRQDLAAKREHYLAMAELLGKGVDKSAEAIVNAWLNDPFSGRVARKQPWRAALLRGRASVADGKPKEAERAFDEALALLRGGIVKEAYHDRHSASVNARSDVYIGRARLAMRAGGDANMRLALDRLDELRWLRQRMEAGQITTTIPTLRWTDLSAALGAKVSVVGIVEGEPGVVTVLLWSDPDRLLTRRFRWALNGPTFARSIEDAVAGDPKASASLGELSRWLAANIDHNRPVALWVSPECRAAGLHLITVGADPLAIRNPTFYVGSLRGVIDAASRSAPPSGDRVVIGLPVLADNSRGTIGEFAPMTSEPELRNIKADRFFWGPEATLQRTREALNGARRAHLSTHGQIDPLHLDHSGLALAGGEVLNLSSAAKLSLQGPLVVLSACESGRRAHPFYAGVPAIDATLVGAGAAAVVSTPWSPRADVAAEWMVALHDALDQGQNLAQAAQTAYRRARASHPDSSDWGAFSVVGLGLRSY